MDEKLDKSIDELLAEENKKFDARLAAEADAKTEKRTAKPVKEKVRPKVQGKRVGEVAHSHFAEEDFEIVERPCLYVEHNCFERLYINEVQYHGRVVVPQCVANYLTEMEGKLRRSERSVFQDRGGRSYHGELKG